MSAATEFPPVVFIPERARPRRERFRVLPEEPRVSPAPQTPATALLAHPRDVSVLEQWSRPTLHALVVGAPAVPAVAPRVCAPQLSEASSLHLTVRGARVLALLALVAAAAVIAVAWLSTGDHGGSAAGAAAPATVTVHSGDTLWSVARSVAPGRDPRNEVDDLVRLNHLSSVAIQPGQILRTR